MNEKSIFYTVDEVSARFKVSRAFIYRGARQGWFPKPKKIGPQAVRWTEEDLLKYEAGMKTPNY